MTLASLSSKEQTVIFRGIQKDPSGIRSCILNSNENRVEIKMYLRNQTKVFTVFVVESDICCLTS